MKISEYVKEYTSGERIRFRHVLIECGELAEAVFSLNGPAAREEFEDVFHFLQVWLFWRFGLNGEPWKITRDSVKKFMDRREVWRKIYRFAGLPENISNYVGNYNRIEKVVAQLSKFGVTDEKARAAHMFVLKSEGKL